METAERTHSNMRDSDTAVRMGGDEFVLMLEDLSRRAKELTLHTPQVAEKPRLVLAKPYSIDGVEYHCSASGALDTSETVAQARRAFTTPEWKAFLLPLDRHRTGTAQRAAGGRADAVNKVGVSQC